MTIQYPQDSVIRVAILEDHELTRRGMQLALHDDQGVKIVESSDDPQSFLAAIAREHPDLVLLDLKIQGDVQIGMHTVEQIKSRNPETKCLVMTSFPTIEIFVRAINLGVEGFICKDTPAGRNPDLAQLVRTLMDGRKHFDSSLVTELASILPSAHLQPNPPSDRHGSENPLTEREMEVLNLVRQDMTNEMIARTLTISVNTVKTHMRNICAKLEVDTRKQAVIVARSKGWL